MPPTAAPSRPTTPATPSPVVLACVLALLIACSLAGALRAWGNWRAADPIVATQDAVQRRALQLNQQIRVGQAILESGLAAYARSQNLDDLRARLGSGGAAGFAVLSDTGQVIAASDAAAVAPAKAVAASFAGALPHLQLLEDRQELGLLSRSGDVSVVLLLRPVGDSRRTRLAQPRAANKADALVGYGGLLVQPNLNDRTRWLMLGVDLLISLIPLTMGVLLWQWTRRTTAAVRVVAAELDRTRKRFRIAVNGAGAGVFEFNAEGAGTLQISSRLRTLLQASGDNLSTESFLEKVAEQDRANVRAGMLKAAETGVMEIAFRAATKPGAWIEMRGLAIEDPSLGAVRIVGTGLDDTPRREAEARASAMEKRLRAAIDGYTGPFALWDPRRRLVTCNAAFVQAFNLAQHVKHGADYGAIGAAAANAIRHQQHDQNDPNVRETELKSGAWLKVVERATADGGLVTIGIDITTLKQQEGMLRTAAKEMRQKMQELQRLEGRNRELAKKYEQEKLRAEEASLAKSLFLANMSHELRTPLNAIIGFSEIISSELLGELGNDKYREYATDIFTSGQLLLELINDILDMAKIEAGKWSLVLSKIEPEETIAQVVRLVGRRAEEKGLELLVESEPLPAIEADQRAVKQILLNLLSNAIKFTNSGTVMVRGRVSTLGIALTVADTGAGIPPEYLPRLGRPFEQVNINGPKQVGTGLGLALTRALAEMHGGSMHIESEVGRGTSVTISLPLAPPPVTTAGEAEGELKLPRLADQTAAEHAQGRPLRLEPSH